jgi:hypothetical protein
MTTVEILFRYTAPPNESVAFALAGIRDVYGIRKVSLDAATRTMRVEYDSTRLTSAAVSKLIRMAGLEIAEEIPLIQPVADPEPAPAI